jgi:hypothetical protein
VAKRRSGKHHRPPATGTAPQDRPSDHLKSRPQTPRSAPQQHPTQMPGLQDTRRGTLQTQINRCTSNVTPSLRASWCDPPKKAKKPVSGCAQCRLRSRRARDPANTQAGRSLSVADSSSRHTHPGFAKVASFEPSGSPRRHMRWA